MKTEIIEILKNNGLKKTPKRLSVIEIMEESEKLLTPAEVWSSLKLKFNHVGLPTVYRILQELEQIHIIKQILTADNQMKYFYCHAHSGEHEHFICEICGGVECINSSKIRNMLQELENELNCVIDKNLFQIQGICKNCKKMNKKKSITEREINED